MTDRETTPTNLAGRASDAAEPVDARSAAMRMIDEGNALEEQGCIAEAMARYETAAQVDPQCARAHLNRGNILFAGAQLGDARIAYQRAIACDPCHAGAYFNLGNLHVRAGEFEPALVNYRAAVALKPDFADAFIAIGNALDSLGRSDEAVQNYERALAINPAFAEAHFNLGLLAATRGRIEEAVERLRSATGLRPDYALAHYQLGHALYYQGRIDEALESLRAAVRVEPTMYQAHYDLGLIFQSLRPDPRLEEAAASLRRAVELNPDFARAHRALGILYSNLGRLDAAEASLRRALSIEPQSNEILYELVMVLSALGKAAEAVQLLIPALEQAPTWRSKVAFAHCAASSGIVSNDPRFRAALTCAVTEPWGFPFKLCWTSLNTVMLDKRIADCVGIANGSWPVRMPKQALFGAYGLRALAADCLLHAVLETGPVTTTEFERFLTCARHALLETVSRNEASDPADTAALSFYAALAQQCYINEYIFDIFDAEEIAASSCRARLLALLDSNAAVPPLLLVAVAAYFPLWSLPGASRLLTATEVGAVEALLRLQIRDPLEERALRAGIECLTPITTGVSEEVRSQYEQNPYPRWVKIPIQVEALSFNNELRRTLPFAAFTPLADDSAPEVLVAGCGTGSHSISTAQRFRGARVLAIDLSLSSIAYAKRKTQELGLTNIQYAQADILKLSDITASFDIIESIGVLHHLEDPFAGWRTLLSRLRPGGFMALGFYSELAHRHLAAARKFISARGYGSTADEIRRFRRDIAEQNTGVDLQRLRRTADFYSTSDCRDLLFHVQEHCLTLERIESFLLESKLEFIGFESEHEVQSRYRARFPEDALAVNLRNWTRFETDNPETFAGMYRFWIQKPLSGGR